MTQAFAIAFSLGQSHVHGVLRDAPQDCAYL